MALWTDLVTPAELTGFARAAQEDIERTKGTLGRWLPNTATTDVVVRTLVGSNGSGSLAQYRSFDAETPIGKAPSGERKTFELLPLGLKERVSEYDQLRMRGNDSMAQMLGGAEKAAARIAGAVVDRLEVARGQAIEAGALTINENGVVQSPSFGRAADHTVTAATKWDQAGAKILDDLLTWRDKYADDNNGEMPGSIVASGKVLATLARSDEIRGLVATAVGGTPSIVSVDAINAALIAYGLPPITVYDRRVNGTRVTGDKKVFLLPAAVDPNSGQNSLGATFYGETLEASEPEYGIAPVDQPGLVVGAWKTKDPIALWVHGNAIAVPVLVNPAASMVATVLT